MKQSSGDKKFGAKFLLLCHHSSGTTEEQFLTVKLIDGGVF